MPMMIRTTQVADAKPMALLINKIIVIGGTTAYRHAFDEKQIVEHFIASPYGINCAVAVDGAEIVGFQVLLWSDPTWPDDEQLPAGWASIGTYVAPDRQARGIGSQLFAATLAAARAAGVRHIDATIRCENAGGQAYYDRMGFVDYRSSDDAISKRLDLA